MNVTVYSDGSFYPNKNYRGGYAYALVSDVTKVTNSGEIPASFGFNNHHFCEMFALAAGILHATRIPGCTSIVALTDSKTCIKFFYAYPPQCKDNLMGLSQKCIRDVQSLGIKLTVRFVKGHQDSQQKGARMNNLVDILAKKSITNDKRI